MKTALILGFALLSFSLVSCKKTVSELPAATQTGANTFGCKIDDQFWVPAGFGIVPTAPTLAASIVGNELYINARNFSGSPTETEFEIYIKDLDGPGNYPLSTGAAHPDYTGNYAYYVHRKYTPDNEWVTTSPYTGNVTITKIDTVNHFVSGTFEFRAINLYNTPQPINVTEGRFDIKTE